MRSRRVVRRYLRQPLWALRQLEPPLGTRLQNNDMSSSSNSLLVASFERHYRIGELASLWRLSRETVRKICVNEPGVLKVRLGRKKSHTTYSVPESVARRIHTRLVNGC